MDAKPWYQSKTLWVNILTLIAGGLTIAAEQAGALDPATGVRDLLLLALAIVNGALRLVTDRPIAGTPAARER